MLEFLIDFYYTKIISNQEITLLQEVTNLVKKEDGTRGKLTIAIKTADEIPKGKYEIFLFISKKFDGEKESETKKED